MALSAEDKKVLNEFKTSALKEKLGKSLFTIYEFQNLVVEGLVTDDLGIAKLVINDEIKDDYNIFIDRQCILRSGSIISFWGLLKMYGEENLKIKYII